jgi:hypothetical protein
MEGENFFCQNLILETLLKLNRLLTKKWKLSVAGSSAVARVLTGG